ncbi:hypothetical protein JX266_011207 [Neoarthrinium moseri]|nr:hypothetical protein JX266_011207 [Neoarthrinium moseri]
MAATASDCRWATEEDWELHRNTIWYLYCKLHKPLRVVAELLGEKHDFRATVKMYKSRLKKWGFRKNLTKQEFLEVQRQLYTGHVIMPTSHGLRLGSRRLKALVRSAEQRHEELEATRPNTPAPMHVRAPEHLWLVESALHEVCVFTRFGISTQRWDFSTTADLMTATCVWGTHLGEAAVELRIKRDFGRGFQMLSDCCAQFSSIARLQEATLVWAFFTVIVELDTADELVALSFINFVAKMCAIELGPSHPVTKLSCNLRKMDYHQIRLCAASIILAHLDVAYSDPRQGPGCVALFRLMLFRWLCDGGLLSKESWHNELAVAIERLRRRKVSQRSEPSSEEVLARQTLASWLAEKEQFSNDEAYLLGTDGPAEHATAAKEFTAQVQQLAAPKISDPKERTAEDTATRKNTESQYSLIRRLAEANTSSIQHS